MTTAKLTAAYEATLDAITASLKRSEVRSGEASQLAKLHDSLAPYANQLGELLPAVEFHGHADTSSNADDRRSVNTEQDAAPTVEAEVIAAANHAIYSHVLSRCVKRSGSKFDLAATIESVGKEHQSVVSELGVAKQAATDAEKKLDIYRVENSRLYDLAAKRGEQLEEYRGIVVSKKDYEALKQKLARAEARVDEANNLALRKQEEARNAEDGHKRAADLSSRQFDTILALKKELRETKAKLAQVDAATKAKIDAATVASFYNAFPTFGSRA